MPAYLVVWTTVTDAKAPEVMKKYAARSPEILARYGGQYRFVGRGVTVLEGDWNADGFVVLEFDSRDDALRWWESDDYAPLKEMRREVATSTILLTPDAA